MANSPVTTSSAAADSVVGLDEYLVASRSLFLGVQSVLACHPLRSGWPLLPGLTVTADHVPVQSFEVRPAVATAIHRPGGDRRSRCAVASEHYWG